MERLSAQVTVTELESQEKFLSWSMAWSGPNFSVDILVAVHWVHRNKKLAIGTQLFLQSSIVK